MHQDLIAASAKRQSQALLARMSLGAPTSQDPRRVAEDPGMGALLHFRSLMALDGHVVQVSRMCFDRAYAYERLALAHTSAHDPLRRLALELFQTFHRRDELRRLAA